MVDFPELIKTNSKNILSLNEDIMDAEGYYYEGNDGSQMTIWTYYADRESKSETHAFDEYVVCVAGQYTEIFDNVEHVLKEGDKLLIPKGTPHYGKVIAGTRTIHAFGGKSILE